jgi:2-furoyl-CoA dehydrogenase large subunit
MLEGAAKIVLNQLFEQLGKTAASRGQGGVEIGKLVDGTAVSRGGAHAAPASAPQHSLWQRVLSLFGVKS